MPGGYTISQTSWQFAKFIIDTLDHGPIIKVLHVACPNEGLISAG